MLKEYVISFKTKKQEKSRKDGAHASFADAKNIGILFTDHPKSNFENIRKIINELSADGKEISTLAFCKSRKKSSGEFPLFDTQDVSFWGGIKTDHLQSFIDNDFDFLVCMDTKKHYLMEFVLAQTKAKYRVGITSASNHFNQYELVIQGSDQNTSSEEILKYLKMIQSND